MAFATMQANVRWTIHNNSVFYVMIVLSKTHKQQEKRRRRRKKTHWTWTETTAYPHSEGIKVHECVCVCACVWIKKVKADKSNIIKNLCSRMKIQFSIPFAMRSCAPATYWVRVKWRWHHNSHREKRKKEYEKNNTHTQHCIYAAKQCFVHCE